MPRIFSSVMIPAGIWLTSSVGFAVGDVTRSAWENLGRLNMEAALHDFEVAQQQQPHARLIKLGTALASLGRQNRSAAQVDAVRRMLSGLIRDDPSDDAGIAASYYLIRLEQLFTPNPDRATLVTAYSALLANHPGHPVAELGAPKLAILLLHDDVPEKTWLQRAHTVEALLPGLRSRSARRDTRLVLADALLQYRQDHSRALPLIDHCLGHGLVSRPARRGALLLQAAESARQLGQLGAAMNYYESYLRDFPHEANSDEIGRRLTRLRKESAS